MAHSCHDCGSVCYCGGDVDDFLLDGGDTQDVCTHCLPWGSVDFDDDHYLDGMPDEEWDDDRVPGCDCYDCMD